MAEDRSQFPAGLTRLFDALERGKKWAEKLPASVKVVLDRTNQDELNLMGGWILDFPERVIPGFFESVSQSRQCIYVVDQALLLPVKTNRWGRLTAQDRQFFCETLNQFIAELGQLDSTTTPLVLTQGHINLVIMLDPRHRFGGESCFPPVTPLDSLYLGHVGAMEGGISLYNAAENRLTFNYDAAVSSLRSMAARII